MYENRADRLPQPWGCSHFSISGGISQGGFRKDVFLQFLPTSLFPPAVYGILLKIDLGVSKMWKCPVCEKENETLLCACGFDGSMDYEAWPTFGQLGEATLDSRAAKRVRLRRREEDLLKCAGCGGSTFAFHMGKRTLQCARCGCELDRYALSALVGDTVASAVPPVNTGFANANEMLEALGLVQLVQPVPQGSRPTINTGFRSADEMLESLGIDVSATRKK